MPARWTSWIVFCACCATTVVAQDRPLDGPLSPHQAPLSFRLEPGLRIELVASEPMIESPVAMAFDERGRLFVAENRGYPTGPSEGAAPPGRIALLTDTDSDGDMDTRTTFAEGLSYPNGLLPWNGGLIVTCAPEILFLRDTDGNGKADEREVWFIGFSTAGSTQLRVSHPTFGPDNWIYVTSGLTGGKVTNPQAPDRPAIELGRTDFRFRPDRTAWEAIDGGAQFGQTFDDFGRRFICYNRVQAQHVVLTSAILRRQPKLTFSETVQNCPADMVAEPSRGHGTAARLYPISSNVTTADSHAGTFTAACGVTVFRGDKLPPGYQGGIFSCDPTGNLVHFDRLEPNGATFAARRARDGQEFLASTDNWFRPVYLAHGPDGALYVCDMYRKTIEHPDYLPVEVRKHTDFNSGKDKGRIWRVVASDATPAALTARRRLPLAELPVGGLLAILEEQNGWRRETARRLLATKTDDGSGEALRKAATDPAAAGPALVCAVSLLDAGNAVDDGVLDFLIAHPEPAIREFALRLAEPRLVDNPHLLEHALTLTGDENPRVRFQSAIALGACAANKIDQNERLRRDQIPSRISVALAKLGARDGADRWTRAAVLSATAGREEVVFVALLAIARDEATVSEAFLFDQSRLTAAASSPEQAARLATELVDKPVRRRLDEFRMVAGFAQSFRQRGEIPEDGNVLRAMLNAAAGNVPLASLIDVALHESRDSNAAIADRKAAVEILGHAGWDISSQTLLTLLDQPEPVEVQLAAARALATLRRPEVARELLATERFSRYSPALRDEVFGSLLALPIHVRGLLTAVQEERVPAIAIDAFRRRQLTGHSDPELRAAAQKIFGTVTGDRAKVYESYKDVVDLKSNATNGKVVFKRVCANCHRLDREGYAVGPDLFSIRNQPKPTILLHILVPDHEITEGFTSYTVLTRDGRTLSGLIAAENPTSITLRMQQGKEEALLRSDLDEIVASKVSLMPQGVEKDVTRQEFADLLAYLKGEAGVD